MRATIMAWAVILAFQMLLVTFFFKPFVREITVAIYGTILALQGYRIVTTRLSWLHWMESLLK